MPALVTGNPVRGDDFFDREVDRRRLWRALERDNVLLLSARRVGKTSLLMKLRDDAKEHEALAAMTSVADARSELEVLRKVYRAVVGVDGSVFQRVGDSTLGRLLQRWAPKTVGAGPVQIEFADGAEEAWTDLARALVDTLVASKRRWILLVDELPIFVLTLLRSPGGRERAVAFLDAFRDVRQRAGDVRWVLAGSVGLDTLAERHRFTASINDLRVHHLGAFDDDAADRYLAAVGEDSGLPLAADVRREIVARVGWPIPFFLGLVVVTLLDLRDEGIRPDVAAVGTAFDRLVRYDQRAYFDHWRQRLYEQLHDREARQAHALLDAAAADHDGASDDTLLQVFHRAGGTDDTALRYLTGLLQADGYVAEEAGRWMFRSPLLREYWRQHARGRAG